MKKEGSRLFFGQFFAIFHTFFFFIFLEKGGFYTLEPPGSPTMVIGSNIRGYREFKGRGGQYLKRKNQFE
jgi:hypothetical protein